MAQATGTEIAPKSPETRAWAYGGMIFAATMLVVLGVFQIFLGIAAVVRGSFFVVSPNYYYRIDVSTWGWIHLGVGIAAVAVGLFLYTGMMWARVLAVIMAGLSAIANFFFLPYYPLWSILIIAIDVFVIWAVVTVGSRREVQETRAEYLGLGAAAEPYPGRTTGMEQTGQRWPATNQPSERARTAEPPKAAPAEGAARPEGGATGSAFTGRRQNPQG